MKKRIILLGLLLFLTGCSCEYNLNIDNNTYQESINIITSSSDELTSLNNEWKIPVDKELYNLGGDSTTSFENVDTYKYKMNSNGITFSNDFTMSGIINSSAISSCFSKATIKSYNDSIIISTSNNIKCFDNYPNLDKLTINITTTRNVKSNNANSVNNSTYTWIFNRNDNNNEGINITIDNKETNSSNSNGSSKKKSFYKKITEEYEYYLVLLIGLLIFIIASKLFEKFKNKNNSLDD